MNSYVLVVVIDEFSLTALHHRGSGLAVAKAACGAAPSVVWLARPPALRTAISWSETYGLYAAEIPPRSGAPIRPLCRTYPARDRALYTFLGHAFGRPADMAGIPREHFIIRNDGSHQATFGLLQQASIDGELVRAPVNAVVVPPTLRADFRPLDTVHVWLHAGALASGSIAPALPVGASAVRFARDHPVQYLRYDPLSDAVISLAENHS